jgi:HPt (histidine-containing phosphotransfer) domain-containing protein
MRSIHQVDESALTCGGPTSRDLDGELLLLLDGFVGRLQSRKDALLLVLRRGDSATALRLLHQLEGSSAMYGLHGVSARARQISDAVSQRDMKSAIGLTKSLNDPELICFAF